MQSKPHSIREAVTSVGTNTITAGARPGDERVGGDRSRGWCETGSTVADCCHTPAVQPSIQPLMVAAVGAAG